VAGRCSSFSRFRLAAAATFCRAASCRRVSSASRRSSTAVRGVAALTDKPILCTREKHPVYQFDINHYPVMYPEMDKVENNQYLKLFLNEP